MGRIGTSWGLSQHQYDLACHADCFHMHSWDGLRRVWRKREREREREIVRFNPKQSYHLNGSRLRRVVKRAPQSQDDPSQTAGDLELAFTFQASTGTTLSPTSAAFFAATRPVTASTAQIPALPVQQGQTVVTRDPIHVVGDVADPASPLELDLGSPSAAPPAPVLRPERPRNRKEPPSKWGNVQMCQTACAAAGATWTLAGADISGVDAPFVAQAIADPLSSAALHTLILRDNRKLSDTSAVQIVRALSLNVVLTKLDMSSTSVGDQCAAEFKLVLPINTTLKHVNLHSCLLSDEGVALVRDGLRANTSMREFTVECSENHPTARWAINMELLLCQLRNPHVTRLKVVGLSESLFFDPSASSREDSVELRLDLSDQKVWEECSAELSRILHQNHSLTALDLRNTSAPKSVSMDFVLSRLTLNTVTELDASAKAFDDQDVASIAEALIQNERLLRLNLDSNGIGDKGANDLRDALDRRVASLDFLSINENDKIDSAALVAVNLALVRGQMRQGTGKAEIDATDKDFGDDEVIVIADMLQGPTTFVCLNLSRNPRITGAGLTRLVQALHRKAPSTFERLILDDLQDETAPMRKSVQLAMILSRLRNPSVSDIDASGHDFSDSDGQAILEALRPNSTVTRLNLDANGRFTAPMLKALRLEMLLCKTRNPSVVDLDASHQGLDDANVAHLIEALRGNAHVTRLDLGHNIISDKGAESLGELLRNKSSLVSLLLSHNCIADEGATALGRSLLARAAASALSQLDLSHNDIGDDGATALAQTLECNSSINMTSSLTALHLDHNRISDVGAYAIGHCLSNAQGSALSTLGLSGNRISAAPLISLFQSFTSCLQLRVVRVLDNPIGDECSDQLASQFFCGEVCACPSIQTVDALPVRALLSNAVTQFDCPANLSMAQCAFLRPIFARNSSLCVISARFALFTHFHSSDDVVSPLFHLCRVRRHDALCLLFCTAMLRLMPLVVFTFMACVSLLRRHVRPSIDLSQCLTAPLIGLRIHKPSCVSCSRR
jgi:Ran GTPase-activating protein (RanGAP) involved in mRNA processing and transport